MKLISLNLWGGKLYQTLMDFINKNSRDTDIYCFQEVFKTATDKTESAGFRLNLYEELCKSLPNHQGYFVSCVENYIAGSFQPDFVDFNLSWGLAIFINKKIKVSSSDDFFVFGGKDTFTPQDRNSFPRSLQHITFTNESKEFIVGNLHGIWTTEGKQDSPARISQSNQINDFFEKYDGGKILCGDFNLDINTQSINILKKNFKNLIREHKIETTRNKHFPGTDKFADYTFVSDDIKVKNFEVPNV